MMTTSRTTPFLILILATLLPAVLIGQATTVEKWMMPDKTIRFRLALSRSVPDLSTRIADEFEMTGFGDIRSSHTGIWVLSFESSEDYPVREGSATGAEFGVDVRLHPHWWLGVSIGKDASAGALGFRRLSSSSISVGQAGYWPLFHSSNTSGHTAYRHVSSGYISLRAEYRVASRSAIYFGPTLDMLWISNGEFIHYQTKKQIRPGGIAGVQLSLNRWLQVFAEGRMRPAVSFDAFSITSSEDGEVVTSHIQGYTLRMNHLRLGARVALAF